MTDQPQDTMTENPLDYVRTYQFHPSGSYYVLQSDHLSEIAQLRARLAAAEKVIAAADDLRGPSGKSVRSREDAYDAARRAWEGTK